MRDCGIIRSSADSRHHRENCNMPSTIKLYLIGVWFCVGFFTGAGWAVAAWLVGRILANI